MSKLGMHAAIKGLQYLSGHIPSWPNLLIHNLCLNLPLPVSQLGLHVGMKGLQYLSGHIPSWLSYAERERLEVRCPAAQTTVKLCSCT